MLWDQQNSRLLMEISLSPLWDDKGISLAIMGILVVFLALALVVVSITLLPRVLARIGTPAVQESSAITEDQLSEEAVAVIAAAVAEVLATPHRIVRIRGLTPQDLGWSLEGRMKHHQSHQLHHRDRR